MKMRNGAFELVTLALVATVALTAPAAAAGPEIASVSAGATAIVWQPAVAYERMVLTVSGPDGVFSQEYDAATLPSLDLYDAEGYPLADGSYTWELRAEPVVGPATRRAMAEARATGDYSKVDALRRAGELPSEPMVLSGWFRVHEGALVGDADEDAGALDAGAPIATSDGVRSTSDETVITGDLTVYNSLCVGVDCAAAESYGADTIRLKENNLRIHFDDTSNSGSFPNRDWRLVANDQANGGRNVFYLEDSTGGTQVLSVEAGAGNNALYVDDGGRVGFGTSTPSVDLHVVTGNSPALRLEQDGSSGFTPQTWDLAGNEANFFVRDVTGGSTLPFRIEPGTATNTLYLDNQEFVGIGTNGPDADLHVRGTDGTTQVHVEDTGAAEILLVLESAGVSTRFQVDNGNSPATAPSFSIGQRQNGRFFITEDGTAGDEFSIDVNGDILVGGAVVHTSSRAAKHDITPVDPRDVLARVVGLPVAEWTYNHDEMGQRHMGPMAEDFWDTFGIGRDGKTLAPMDTAGVALAAIQGLNQVVEEKDRELDELRGENAELAARLAALEELVQTLTSR